MNEIQNDNQLIYSFPDAVAYYKITTDEQNNPVDYTFLKVNKAFETMVEKNKEEIINRKGTDIFPQLRLSKFQDSGSIEDLWTKGKSNRFEFYLESLETWYEITAYSDKPGYLAVIFRNINETKNENILLSRLSDLTNKNYNFSNDAIDYQFISDELLKLSGAKFVVINTYKDNNIKSIGKVISGEAEEIEKASKIVGYDFTGKEWINNPERLKSTSEGCKLIQYDSLHDVSFGGISKSLSQLLKKKLDLGNIYEIVMFNKKQTIGDIIFIMPSNKTIVSSRNIELYVQQIAMVLIRYETEKSLKETNALLDGILRSIQDGICVLNTDLTIRYANEIFKKRHEKELPLEGKQCYEVHYKRNTPCRPCPTLRSMKTGRIGRQEMFIENRWLEVFSYPLFEKEYDKPTGAVKSIRDITEQKQAEERIKYLSFHDTLTGLHNRNYFEEEFTRLNVKRQLPISIIIADVNGLKLVNDTCGHDEGDKVLISASQILRKACRKGDIITRWGGDEFIILLPKTSYEAAEKITARIKKECKEIQSKKLSMVEFAIGVATKENSEKSIKQLFKEADDHMYKDKIKSNYNDTRTKKHIAIRRERLVKENEQK
ncbi:MAG: sensor domain-containing diguanylate cyclase [Clostridiaceae bacterium]|nr:sensor domain-containing diguanylate cyclase [Clostridiaceae bacterium]